MVEKVIAGGYDDEGNADPSMITFVYKTGFEDKKKVTLHAEKEVFTINFRFVRTIMK